MKKLLAVLLVVALAFSFAACTKPADGGDDTETGTPVVGGQIIYGSTTELSGDWGRALWTNNASDKLVRDLMDGYGTVVSDQGGKWTIDPTVVADYKATENEDGTSTYTVKINKGLVYNDGTAITAKDYVVETLLGCSSVLTELGGTSTAVSYLVGGKDYYDAKADVLSGLRLIDEYTFSVTINAEFLPYFYELTYMAASPMNATYWFGEGVDVADDGNGCYFTGDFTAEAVQAAVETARYASDNRLSCGPYTLTSFDQASLQATLEINPNYAGNFEGQKPYVEKLVIVKAEDATWSDALKTGQFEFFDTITSGDNINTALDIIDEGGFDYVQFDRAGYGKIHFCCDFGPTQFPAVRKAVALMLDRNEFANTFCKGWGGTVDGPYGTGLWQYKDTQEWLAENLDSYAYDAERAIEVLAADGWVYNADGTDYTSGIRYKEVTAEEAANYESKCVTVGGKTLMPLVLEWAASEGNSVSELLTVMLAENPDVATAGMQINKNEMTFSDLLNYLYRDFSEGDQYGLPAYSMFNLATGFTPSYEQVFEFSLDPMYAGTWNNNFLYDQDLYDSAYNMVYGVESDDTETYLSYFKEFMLRWNELLPDVPLYSNVYISVYPEKLKGYTQDSFWDFSSAILYSWIDEA